MTGPSSPRVVDILADLAIQDAVDDYLQGADQVAAHQLWVRERMAASDEHVRAVMRDANISVECGLYLGPDDDRTAMRATP